MTECHKIESSEPLHNPPDYFSHEVSSIQTTDRHGEVLHLLPADDSVSVQVVQVEGPLQLLLGAALHQHRQPEHEVLHSEASLGWITAGQQNKSCQRNFADKCLDFRFQTIKHC